MADIEHRNLPDNLLHEPKGTATALANTTYMADGKGSGQYRKVSPVDLDINVRSLPESYITVQTDTVDLDSNEIVDTSNGVLEPVTNEYNIATINAINHNTSELARLYSNQKQINEDIDNNIKILKTNIEKIFNYLRVNGFLS